MLLNAYPPDMVTHDEEVEMTRFICLFYAPYFLQARLSTATPRLDLTLWQHMNTYQKYDADEADQVTKSILGEPWYLTQECVVFSSFHAEVLLTFQQAAAFGPKKPDFPSQTFQQGEELSLASFIGPNS